MQPSAVDAIECPPLVRRCTHGSNVQLSLDDLNAPRGLGRAGLMTSREVAELLDVPVSTVLERGRNDTRLRVKNGRDGRFMRDDPRQPQRR